MKRFLIGTLLGASLTLAGVAVADFEYNRVRVDEEQVIRALSARLATMGITTQAQFNAAIDGTTDAQVAAIVRALLKQGVKIR